MQNDWYGLSIVEDVRPLSVAFRAFLIETSKEYRPKGWAQGIVAADQKAQFYGEGGRRAEG
jgi:hypothetical protein